MPRLQSGPCSHADRGWQAPARGPQAVASGSHREGGARDEPSGDFGATRATWYPLLSYRPSSRSRALMIAAGRSEKGIREGRHWSCVSALVDADLRRVACFVAVARRSKSTLGTNQTSRRVAVGRSMMTNSR